MWFGALVSEKSNEYGLIFGYRWVLIIWVETEEEEGEAEKAAET